MWKSCLLYTSQLVGAKAATCTEDGYTGDQVCTVCGETVKKGETVPATGHHYKDGKCTDCGETDPNYKPAVKTGDDSNTTLWVMLLTVSALLAAAVVEMCIRDRPWGPTSPAGHSSPCTRSSP